jgi:hypothetical protein
LHTQDSDFNDATVNASEAIGLVEGLQEDGRSIDTVSFVAGFACRHGTARAVTDPPTANVESALEDGHKEIRMKNTRYVKKATSGRGWDVVREGHRRATAHGATKADAVKTARELIRREGGGEIRILNRTGKVVDASKVARPRKRAAA